MAKRVAGVAVHPAGGGKVGNLLEPLLEGSEEAKSLASSMSSDSDESSHYSSDTTAVSIHVKQTAWEMMKTAVVGIVLMFGTVASAGSMVVAPAVAVLVMAGVSLAHTPFSAYKEYRIMKLPALRNLNNKLREEAELLEVEVDTLVEEIELLEPEARRTVLAEEELETIASKQHGNARRFVALVKENEGIVGQLRESLRQRVVQDIIKSVITSDKNNDGKFCKVESKMLVLKISLALQAYGVEFDENKFYKVMSPDPSVIRTLAIVKRLVPALGEGEESNFSGEEEEEEEEEECEDEDDYDMFHLVADRSTVTSALAGSLSIPVPSVQAPRRISLTIHPKHRRSTLTSKETLTPSLLNLVDDADSTQC